MELPAGRRECASGDLLVQYSGTVTGTAQYHPISHLLVSCKVEGRGCGRVAWRWGHHYLEL